MTTEQSAALILQDAEGNYYIFDEAAFARARVPDAQRAQLDAQRADVSGYCFAVLPPSQTEPSAGLPILGRIGAFPPITGGWCGPISGGPISGGPVRPPVSRI